MEQKDEKQCQGCKEWLDRKGNTCFPRAYLYVLTPVNETAEAAHKSTFGNCPYKGVK